MKINIGESNIRQNSVWQISHTCMHIRTYGIPHKKFTFRTMAILSKYAYLRGSSCVPYFILLPRTYVLARVCIPA